MSLSFSQRNGYKPASKAIQRESLDTETRNGLWNEISPFFAQYHSACSVYMDLWTGLFKMTADTQPVNPRFNDTNPFYQFYRTHFLNEARWNECFDFMEFVVASGNRKKWSDEIRYHDEYRFTNIDHLLPSAQKLNSVLEHESCAYRFVSGQVIEITSKEEIASIEEAADVAPSAIKCHLEKALKLLSDRKHPDYPNSAKESISAIESHCCLITGKDSATLGDALKSMGAQMGLHPALKDAFSKLYGYTSNEDGIRHGGIEIPTVDYALAKFMLVSCSAFINYLQVSYSEQNEANKRKS